MAKCGMNLFLLSSIILHWKKALWMLRSFIKCAMVLKKPAISSFFNGQRWTKCAMNILLSYLNWWHNWQFNNRRLLEFVTEALLCSNAADHIGFYETVILWWYTNIFWRKAERIRNGSPPHREERRGPLIGIYCFSLIKCILHGLESPLSPKLITLYPTPPQMMETKSIKPGKNT